MPITFKRPFCYANVRAFFGLMYWSCATACNHRWAEDRSEEHCLPHNSRDLLAASSGFLVTTLNGELQEVAHSGLYPSNSSSATSPLLNGLSLRAEEGHA